jgi:hypothetical protein
MNIPKFGVTRVAATLSSSGLIRHRRRSVGPFHQRRHALPHVVLRRRHLEDAAARVGVRVDEPRRDHLSRRVDDARGRRVDFRRDARDGVAAHREIGAIPRAAGAVDDAPFRITRSNGGVWAEGATMNESAGRHDDGGRDKSVGGRACAQSSRIA